MNNESKVLLGVKSPSALNKAGELLPPRVIELKWVYCQSLVPKILSKVSTLFPVSFTITSFLQRYVCRPLGLETNGMVVYFLPQFLDCMPACEG